MSRRGVVVLFVVCLCLSACVRLPQRTRGHSGPTQNIDLSFMKSGQTTRPQVLEKLKPVDTGLQSNRFFVGRWETSKWLKLMSEPNVRSWETINLIVEFDETGTVKSYEAFPDAILIQKLLPVVREAKLSPTECMDVALLQGEVVPIKVLLSSSRLELIQTDNVRKSLHFAVPAEQLTNIGTLSLLASPDALHSSDVQHIEVVLHFAGNLKKFGGPRGDKLHFVTTVPQLVTLLSFGSKNAEKAPTASAP